MYPTEGLAPRCLTHDTIDWTRINKPRLVELLQLSRGGAAAAVTTTLLVTGCDATSAAAGSRGHVSSPMRVMYAYDQIDQAEQN